jgi:hypothetical protein
MKKIIKDFLYKFNLEIRRINGLKNIKFPIEMTDKEMEIIAYVKNERLSMVSDERLFNTLLSCKYVIQNNIPGDFVECGVWRGGNSLIAAAMFDLYCQRERKIYLFDTFAGMTKPTDDDKLFDSTEKAIVKYTKEQANDHNKWCYASLEDVRLSFQNRKLLNSSVKFIKGDVSLSLHVEENLPKDVSVLRLDTDWYESTKVEMEILYPLLGRGGVFIVDDYGHWSGAKKAVDEYFQHCGTTMPFMQYIDYTGRSGVKY